ncbi:MAG: hypothetical protein IT423_11625 [Pirellulaceae bacterium]|nr:hypothetical protein [Pirellulaceae bacterium]
MSRLDDSHPTPFNYSPINNASTYTSLGGRRAFLAALTTSLILAPSALVAQKPKKPALLQAPRDISELATRTRIVLQLSGTLKVADPDPASKKPPREAEVKAESTVDFDERIYVNPQNETLSAARHYNEASVQTWVAGNASSHRLREECFHARLARHEGSWQQYCPDRPLQTREVDLVRLPINSVVLDQMLPADPVKADDSWSPSERTLADVFQLEAVHSSSIHCRVLKVEAGVATIECNGEIEGSVNNVPTKIKVNGNMHAALGSQCALVTWVGMSLTEIREISQAEPGFTLTARVKLIRKEEPEACNDVSLDELRQIAQSNDDGRWLLQIASVPGRYQMLADRRWKTIVDTGEEAILRLIEKNQVVAQCNVTRLPKLAAGQQLTLVGMQDDIKRSLEKNLESLVEASERKNSGGMRVLRVVAVGKSSDVPVRWVYAHISDDSGRRVSLVFTMSGEASESFGMADEQMISSFELLPETSTQSPTPAQPAAESASRPTTSTKR